MKENSEQMSSFQSDYKKLAELCAETNNHLVLQNLHIKTDDLDFEGKLIWI